MENEQSIGQLINWAFGKNVFRVQLVKYLKKCRKLDFVRKSALLRIYKIFKCSKKRFVFIFYLSTQNSASPSFSHRSFEKSAWQNKLWLKISGVLHSLQYFNSYGLITSQQCWVCGKPEKELNISAFSMLHTGRTRLNTYSVPGCSHHPMTVMSFTQNTDSHLQFGYFP